MMAGNPNWWNMHPPSSYHHHHHPSSLLSSTPNNFFPAPQYVDEIGSQSSFADDSSHGHQLAPQSWSQLLLGGGLCSEEDNSYKLALSHHQFQTKRLDNWEEQLQILNAAPSNNFGEHHAVVRHHHPLVDVKQEYGHHHGRSDQELLLQPPNNTRPTNNSWPHGNNNSSNNIMPVSSPTSCVTTLNNNILDFSGTKLVVSSKSNGNQQQHPDHSSECNSTATGGACKKARVHPTSSQVPLKVRKEKLGDRITALHQLVSPFGKTDTASVLLEAIGYIRFLQGQIEALSSPYLRNNNNNNGPANIRNHQSVQGEGNYAFPGDTTSLQVDNRDKPKDLRSRGLCLVPVSCTLQVGNESGADYWAPALGGGF